ncbi:MAG: glycosyltransferase [Candidatus Dadabacteria bacterium]|nr:MAG: glycosyltransferase [Candidatus Dadabacteria bacterium]
MSDRAHEAQKGISPEQMHVVHINLEAGWRGGERQVALLVAALAERGVRQTVVVRRGGALDRRFRELNLPVEIVTAGNRLEAAARLLARDCHRAVFHAHTGHAIPIALIASRRHQGALVVHRRVAFRPRSSLLRRADQVIALSTVVAERCVEAGVSSECIAIIPPILDPALRTPERTVARQRLGIPEDSFVGVTIAALAPEKNVELMLQAIRHVDGVRHYWIGDGPVPDGAVVSDGLHFPGFRTDIADWLGASDYFLLPSWSEGFGSSVLDAIQAGCPLILSDIPGLRAWVPEDAAWWFDPRSATDAAAAIRACRRRPDLAGRRVEAARQVLANSAAGRVAEQTLSVYAKAVKRRS